MSKEQACLALTEHKSQLPLLAGASAVCIGDGEQGMIPVPKPHCLVCPGVQTVFFSALGNVCWWDVVCSLFVSSAVGAESSCSHKIPD